jgi:outer membrane protein TolC
MVCTVLDAGLVEAVLPGATAARRHRLAGAVSLRPYADVTTDASSIRAIRLTMRLLCWVLSLVTLAVLPAGLAARQVRPQALTADESVRLGLERNAGLRAARADADAARALYGQARAAMLPAIRTQASYTRLSGNIPEVEFTLPGLDTTFTVLPVEVDRYQSEVSFEQPLFTGFRLLNQTRAANLEADAAAYEVEQEQADVAFEIRRVYWALYGAIAVRDAVATSLAQVEAHLGDVRNRVEAGAALTSELLAAQTRRSEVMLERVEAENAVRVAQLELSRLTGLPLDSPVQPVAEANVDPPVAVTLDELTARAIEARPQLRALAARVAAFGAQVAATRGHWFPDLGFLARYVYARPNPYFFTDQDQFRGTWELGASMQWDLFEGGRRIAETGEAQARLRGAEARLEHAREQVAVDVARQYLEVRRADEAIAVALQNIEAAEEGFRVARDQFQEGMVLSAQVLEAEEAVHGARTRHAQAIVDHQVARAALLNALGQVW